MLCLFVRTVYWPQAYRHIIELCNNSSLVSTPHDLYVDLVVSILSRTLFLSSVITPVNFFSSKLSKASLADTASWSSLWFTTETNRKKNRKCINNVTTIELIKVIKKILEKQISLSYMYDWFLKKTLKNVNNTFCSKPKINMISFEWSKYI